MLIMAVVVGAGAGLGAIAFIWMIGMGTGLFFGQGARALGFMGRAYVIVIPALGGLIVGPLLHFFAPKAKGHGVPEVLTAIATHGGRIRPCVVLVKGWGRQSRSEPAVLSAVKAQSCKSALRWDRQSVKCSS